MTPRPDTRGKRTVVLVVLLFAAPLLAALVLRVTGWEPGATGNHGELIEPPGELTAGAIPEALRDHWVLVGITGSACRTDCTALADSLLRVRRALGEDGDRVKLVLAGPERRPDFLRDAPLSIAPAALRDGLGTVELELAAGSVIVIDPRGFVMMRYEPGFASSGLLDDLQRLLRYGRVGVQ